jgi:hypothetical protein
MTRLPCGMNAWIFLNEDEPAGTNYNSPDSCYQSLIKHRVYSGLDFLGIAFFEVVPAAQGGSGIQICSASHSDGLTNQDYLDAVLRDARQVNPEIRLLATMVYSGDQTLVSVFAGGGDPQLEAEVFATRLVAYLRANAMNGLDVDWEGDVEAMTQEQFRILFATIRRVFDAQPEKFYLSFTPAWPSSGIDYATLNHAFDFISPQFYDGTPLSAFLEAGMSPARIGYGAQFEPGNAAPNASAQQVWSAVSSGFTYQGTAYDYQDIFVWRLNSGNYQFEQAQVLILAELVQPSAVASFDDTAIVAAAGQPSLTQLTICSGDVLHAIQAVNTGTDPSNAGTQPPGTTIGVFTLLQHGSSDGSSQTISIPLADPIVAVSGYTGVWAGASCVVQLTLTCASGAVHGPFGSMDGATGLLPFRHTGQAGQRVVAFSGSSAMVSVPGGRQVGVITRLDSVFA